MNRKEEAGVYDRIIELLWAKQKMFKEAHDIVENLPGGHEVMAFDKFLETMEYGISVAVNEVICLRSHLIDVKLPKHWGKVK